MLALAFGVASHNSGGRHAPDAGSRGHSKPRLAAFARPTRWPIKHVIYIVKENRTFDQYFGLYPGANGTTRGRTRTGSRPLRQGIPDKLLHDITHDHNSAMIAYNHGKMNGFVEDQWSNRYAYSEALPRDIPMYWRWAQHFVLADHFFSSQRA